MGDFRGDMRIRRWWTQVGRHFGQLPDHGDAGSWPVRSAVTTEDREDGYARVEPSQAIR